MILISAFTDKLTDFLLLLFISNVVSK